MNPSILNTEVQNFIKNNWSADIMSVLLQKPQFKGVTQKELAEQLEAKKKCRYKLSSWFNVPNIYYPNKLNIEQTSSEKTAQYKAAIIKGKTLLDVTGGLGVDSYFFSKKIKQVIHCELNDNLSKIAAHNFNMFGANNITCFSGNGLQFLKDTTSHFDWIVIDPSRRDEAKGKVFLLKDCLPDVTSNLDLFFERTRKLMIKTSPLLDIKQGISELRSVKEIHVVAVNNEVKELLWILEKGFIGDILLKTHNLKNKEPETFDFFLQEEARTQTDLGPPKTYLYEPNTALLKSGAFKILGRKLALKKLHEHSHLYTSDKKVEFPGRTFVVKAILPYSKKGIKQLGVRKANITTRNFPIAVAKLRKLHNIKDGGEQYLFFTTNLLQERIVLQCAKVK